ncbi:hypothetical protein [Halobaculum sp. D14]|uniref:hypothetical protein n=1 Tax=unclassified Halobaculum TaxID=2640896 RepID=UPI003EB78387
MTDTGSDDRTDDGAADGSDDGAADRSGRGATSRLLLLLTAVAVLVALLGLAVVWALAYGPLA